MLSRKIPYTRRNKISLLVSGTIPPAITIFSNRSVRPSGMARSKSNKILARISLISFAAKNRPGHAFRPNPKLRFSLLTPTNWYCSGLLYPIGSGPWPLRMREKR